MQLKRSKCSLQRSWYHQLVNEVSLDRFQTHMGSSSSTGNPAMQRWSSHVWFKGSIPKHAFLLWLAHLDRLSTRERLAGWWLNIPTPWLSQWFIHWVLGSSLPLLQVKLWAGASAWEDWDTSASDSTHGLLSLIGWVLRDGI